MKTKIKKVLYPFVFSALFPILYFSFIFLIGTFIPFPHGSYAPAALAVLFTLAWLIFALPIWCIKYSKMIINEKLKLFFSAYNVLLIIVTHILPFNIRSEMWVFYYFVIWVLFWNTAPLVFRLACRKNSNEKPHRTDLLLQSNKKNIIAIFTTCLYMISLAKEPMTWQFESISYILTYTLPLFSAFLFLVFLFSKNATYSLKSLLLSFSLAGELAGGLSSIFYSLISLDMQLKYIPMYPVTFTFLCLKVLMIAVMFAGTLFDLRHIKLLKYGAAGHALLSAALFVFNLINVGGIAYHQIDSGGTLAINTVFVINSICEVLYFVGLFIITTGIQKCPASSVNS